MDEFLFSIAAGEVFEVNHEGLIYNAILESTNLTPQDDLGEWVVYSFKVLKV